MPLIFISYSSKDLALASQIDSCLQKSDLQTWFAPRDIEAGTSFAERITEGIKKADLLLLVFTSNTNASPHVALELNLAISFGKIIFPVRFEKADPTGTLKYFLGLSQWMDISSPTDPLFPSVIAGIKETLSGSVSPLQTRSTRIGASITLPQLLSQRDAMLIGKAFSELMIIQNKFKATDKELLEWLSFLETSVATLSNRLGIEVDLAYFKLDNLFAFEDSPSCIKAISNIIDQFYYEIDSKWDVQSAMALKLLFRMGGSTLFINLIDDAGRLEETDNWDKQSKYVELPATEFQTMLAEVRNNTSEAIEKILDFRENCASLIEDQLNHEPMFAQYRANIWKMGTTIGLAAAAYPSCVTNDPINGHLIRARTYARTLNITIPPFPEKTTDPIENDVRILHYMLHELGEKFISQMSILYGNKTSALFNAAIKSSTLFMLYNEDYLENDIIPANVKGVETALRKAVVPLDLWVPLLDNVRTHQPTNAIRNGITKLHKDVEEYLSGIVVSSRTAKT